MNADYTDTNKIEQKLKAAVNELKRMAPEVGVARQVKEFSSDRRKSLLSIFMAPLLANESAAAAEAMARSNVQYLKELSELESQYRSAETTLATWQATQAIYEAARSIFSMGKEMLRQME